MVSAQCQVVEDGQVVHFQMPDIWLCGGLLPRLAKNMQAMFIYLLQTNMLTNMKTQRIKDFQSDAFVIN